MYFRALLLPLLVFVSTAKAQKIFAHNDYVQPVPFATAYEQRADFIEADVWVQNGKLVVVHDQPTTIAPTLDSLYIKPIAKLFTQYGDKVSPDRDYTFGLMIDVKDDPAVVLPKLIELLQENLSYFNRTANSKAIQVIVSGNRPRIDTYLDYPFLIQFDGRPSEVYDQETLQRVAMISDNFQSYSRWNGIGDIPDVDREKLKRIIKRAHNDNKPMRFWGAPDTPDAWKKLKKLGVDVISTDKVGEAVKEFH
ncbi:phosphatidylinositol-specific phospholipase C/glycerophosphodiester phosphodiesterase family protein [Spirosoma sp. RP8]|uniref:Phosphatidylinositol-specific phospholipase C/glycerophosphodiester phosphodiesterase family protein n=1 Tax=Spirosoma liriopis TaxID=2937440 RepID=A0ABT0HR76_9BACT|nr:phosphatidylinositol-specific phospholipase C/glycerophosphodiester phosphodiesterase family protein [Spirosoma liriopis]MCK8494485.1 phosphatidylinositol-specific phospholipase C/glycerophosphodiester phosphodiesterase family protein [Spirosoma liriopis]